MPVSNYSRTQTYAISNSNPIFRPIYSCKRVNTTIYNYEVAMTCLVKILYVRHSGGAETENGGGMGKGPKTPH